MDRRIADMARGASRSATSDIVRRRRGNPDPDGVIASQVANRIVANSSNEISDFMKKMYASGPVSTSEMAPPSYSQRLSPPTPTMNPGVMPAPPPMVPDQMPVRSIPQPAFPVAEVAPIYGAPMPQPLLPPATEEPIDPRLLMLLREFGLI